MYAYIKKADGQFYMSAVFGYYRSKDFSKCYWVVLNEEKTRLVIHPALNSKSKHIGHMICIVDADETNWNHLPEEGYCTNCVNYLPAKQIIELIETDSVPAELLARCIAEDKAFVFCDYPEVQTPQDITNLIWATGYFHNVQIAEVKMNADGVLYVRLEGAWDCNAELWFWGDAAYDTFPRDPGHDAPCWEAGSMRLHNGFIYLADDIEVSAKDIENGEYCYFKARHLKYHIIPV